jgi:hypothetical protein
MGISKRQRYKAGAIAKIGLHNNRMAFGRLLPGVASIICVYDFVVNENKQVSVDDILKNPVLFCCGLYRTIITKGTFEIIGIREFTENEIKNISPLFTQDIVNIKDCVIWWPTGEERKASPEECVGLERSAVWTEEGLIERIDDHYAGKRNFHVEDQKVILSEEDPRYLAPPGMLRWDFEKQVFYRTDTP